MSRFNLDVIRDIIMPSMGSIIQKNQSLEGFVEIAKRTLPQSVDVTEISSAITGIKDIEKSLLSSKTLISNKFAEIESIENDANRKIADLLNNSSLDSTSADSFNAWEKTKALIGAAYNYVSITSLRNSINTVKWGVDMAFGAAKMEEIFLKGFGYSLLPYVKQDIAKGLTSGKWDFANTKAVQSTSIPMWSMILHDAVDRKFDKYYGKLIHPNSEHDFDVKDGIMLGHLLDIESTSDAANWEPTNYSIPTGLAIERDLARGLTSGKWDFANTKAQWIPGYTTLCQSSKNDSDTNNFETNNENVIYYGHL